MMYRTGSDEAQPHPSCYSCPDGAWIDLVDASIDTAIDTAVKEKSLPPTEPAALRPFLLEPRFVERIWGADSLGPWFPAPAAGQKIGEVWMTAEECGVTGTSATLRSSAQEHGDVLDNGQGHGFPLLLKLLYPREKLSVQVHPGDEQARALLGQPRGKTECWYVLSAEEDAQVAVGFREPMTPAQIRAHIDHGTIEDKLRMLPVKAGDMVFVDAGTVHAIGPGMVVLETQQYSDVTYRLWDYGRARELHLEQGIAVARVETAAGLVTPRAMEGFDRLVTCPYFTVDRMEIASTGSKPLGCEGRMQVLIALGQGCVLTGEGGMALPLPPGHAAIVPAAKQAYTLRSEAAVQVIRVLGPGAVA